MQGRRYDLALTRIAELETVVENVRDGMGIAIHTGLRKALDSSEAVAAWKAIDNLPDGDWPIVLRFALDGLGVTDVLATKGEHERTDSH